jgi:Zn-dependent alcohol dehydrogenase
MCETFADVVVKQRYRTAARSLTAMCGLGTFAEVAVVHESQLVRVDTALPDAELALIGCAVVSGAPPISSIPRLRRPHRRSSGSHPVLASGSL